MKKIVATISTRLSKAVGTLRVFAERLVAFRSAKVAPGSAIMIKPGCRHRAIGNLKLLNIPVPAFDPADEYFDD